MTMESKQTIRVGEILTGDWQDGALRIVLEANDKKATLIALELRAVTVRTLQMFLTDLLAKPGSPFQSAD